MSDDATPEEQLRTELRRLLAERARDAEELDELRAALKDIRESVSYRLIQSYHARLDRLVPPGSARRARYMKVVRAAAARRPAGGIAAPAGQGHVDVVAAPSTPPVAAPARLLTSSTPTASVVIPVHGQWNYTARCLVSIAADLPDTPFEVIVVDDASPDTTREGLAGVGGLRTVPLEENMGFLGACNAGIEAARGKYVVLLNNDTEVRRGWLDALVDTAERDETVGVVGAKLVYGDGTLQEAGGIIWSDGDGWNYGRGDDPEDLRYTFTRDVDYVSGAALLVRTSLLETLGGGLDPRYSPAYYEDADLCFAAREHGLRVVYNPRSVVVHHEGVSHGTDVSAGIKQHQVTNRETFRAKWATALSEQHPHDAALVPLARSRPSRGRVVVVDHHVPTYDRDAGSLRMWAVLRLLRELGYDVTFVPENKARMEPYSTALQDLGVEVVYGHLDLEGYLADLAPSVVLAVLSRLRVARDHIELVRWAVPGVPVVFDTVDLQSLRERRRSELKEDAAGLAEADQRWQEELAVVDRSQATLVVAAYEQQAVLAARPEARVLVLPTVHEMVEGTPGPEGRTGLLFVGGFRHDPNKDGVLWFVREVLPLIRRRRPDVVLSVVGGDGGDEIDRLAGRGVKVLGWVEDLQPLYDSNRLMVAPLRYGAGVKGKVGESLAKGLPVVGTTVGVEGMHLEHGRDVLVADDPQGFADAVLDLVEDDQRWTALVESGRRTVDEHFGVTATRRAIDSLLATVARPVACA